MTDTGNTSSVKAISRAKAIAFSLIPLVFLLVVGEVGLRVWVYYFRTTYERYNYATGRLELVPNTHATMPGGRQILINSKGFAGREFDAEKPPGTYRIVALGDSCTFGGSWHEAYPEVLQRILNSTGSERRFEVINAGIEGYNSEYALGRLREDVLRYDPDMVTIYIGWNDLMKGQPNTRSESSKYRWLVMMRDRSYLMKAYRKIIYYYLRPMVIRPKVASDMTDFLAFDQFVPASFQKNLEAMLQTLENSHVRPILMTLPTVVRRGMTLEDLERQGVFFPYYAGSYSVDKLLSLHGSYNRTIRAVARRYQVPLVDLDALVERYDKEDLFWDTMHPSVRGHRLVAEALARKISEDPAHPEPEADRGPLAGSTEAFVPEGTEAG